MGCRLSRSGDKHMHQLSIEQHQVTLRIDPKLAIDHPRDPIRGFNLVL